MVVRTYGDIFFNEVVNRWEINNAEPHVMIKLKAVFQKISKTEKNPRFTDNPDNCHDLLWFMDRYPLRISDADRKRLKLGRKEFLGKQADIERILMPGYKPTSVKLKHPWVARDYQLVVADLHARQKAFLLGDDIGLGKTMSACLTFNDRTLPAIVVCQTHLKTHWKRSIESYTNLKAFIINGGKPFNLPPADVYILNYTCLRGWVDVLATGHFKSVIFDEVHELRRDGSDKYRAAKRIVEAVEYTIGMSATPVFNYGDEIFNILDMLKPGCLGQWEDFFREWCMFRGNKIAVSDTVALGAYLRENYLFLRRTRGDVGRELPAVNKIIHTVAYDESEVRKAEDIARSLAIRVISGKFEERGQAARELNALVRHQTGVSKAKEVAAFVKILLEGGEECIVLGGWHRDVYEIWLQELSEYNPVLYTGSETARQKDAAVDDFISGRSRVFVLSLRSGVGIDGLQKKCKCIVLGELDWSPAVHNQIIGRIDRDGQKEKVTAFFCMSEYGTDPVMEEVLGLKAEQAYGIVDPLKSAPVQYSDEGVLIKLANSFLEKTKK